MELSRERFEKIYKLYSQELINISYGYNPKCVVANEIILIEET